MTNFIVTVTKESPPPKQKNKKAAKSGPSSKSAPLKTVNDLVKVAKGKTASNTVKEEPTSSAEQEEGDPPLEEEDDFLASDGEEAEAAVKNAQMALSHVIDVDVEGGWKEGAP